VQDQGDQGYTDDLQRKAEELKRKAFEEEARRLDEEAERRSSELTDKRLSDDAQVFQEKLQEVEEEKRREDLKMKATEDEVQRVLEVERQKRLEARRREELDLKRREAEEQRREEERKTQEELSRRKEEEDRIRRESEEERKREAEKKRAELEVMRREQEKLRREVERQERIQSLLQAAESFFASGDYEHAAIEVAKALVNDPTHPDILALEQKIKEAQGKTATPSIETKAVEPTVEARRAKKIVSSPRKEKSRLSQYITYAVFAALIVLAVVVFLHFKKQIFATPIRIAVIPWNLASNSPEENLTSTGLAADFAQQFEQVKPLAIVGISSVVKAVQTWKEPAQAASRLGYPYFIQGSVSRTGDNYFANLQMVDSSGAILWSRQYVKGGSTLFQLPREAFIDVVGVLNKLTEEKLVPRNPASRPTTAEAYLLYVQGLAHLQDQSPEDVRQALDLFVSASEKDEKFSEPRAAAAEVMVYQLEQGWDTARTSLATALALAEKAVALDSSLGSAYCALGAVRLLEGKYGDAQAQLDRAIELSPRSSAVFLARAKVYFRMGRYNEVMDAMAHAYELNPLDVRILTTYASLHQLTGTGRQAMTYHEALLPLVADSTSYLIGPFADAILSDPGLLLGYSGRVGAAFQRSLQADSADYNSLYGLARMLQVTGQSADATGLLNKLESRLKSHRISHPHDTHAMLLLAKTYTRLGRFSEAAELVKQALKINGTDPDVLYGIAQIYSLQMYSQKNLAIDEKKKTEAMQSLRGALARGCRLDELTSADFYNMYEQTEFPSILQEAHVQ